MNEFATQSKLPPPSKADIQKIFDKYDANKDRKIDYKEFSRMAGEVFNIEIERKYPLKPLRLGITNVLVSLNPQKRTKIMKKMK